MGIDIMAAPAVPREDDLRDIFRVNEEVSMILMKNEQ